MPSIIEFHTFLAAKREHEVLVLHKRMGEEVTSLSDQSTPASQAGGFVTEVKSAAAMEVDRDPNGINVHLQVKGLLKYTLEYRICLFIA